MLLIGGSGLWFMFVRGEVLPPFVFVNWPVGIRSLEMLEGGILGILAVFLPYVFL